jgi:hypothetical protein
VPKFAAAAEFEAFSPVVVECFDAVSHAPARTLWCASAYARSHHAQATRATPASARAQRAYARSLEHAYIRVTQAQARLAALLDLRNPLPPYNPPSLPADLLLEAEQEVESLAAAGCTPYAAVYHFT